MNQPDQSKYPNHTSPEECIPNAGTPVIDSSLRSGFLPSPDSETVNIFTARLARALDGGDLSRFEDQLYNDQSDLQSVLLTRACHHLLALHLEKLEQARPSPADLSAMGKLGEITLATIFQRLAEETLSLDDQRKTLELTTGLSNLILTRLHDEAEASAAVHTSLALLNVATSIVISSEDMIDLLPRGELSTATECVENILNRFVAQSVVNPHVSPPDRDAIISQACLLAAGIKSTSLAPILRATYEALDSQMVELASTSEELLDAEADDNDIILIPFDSTMPRLDSPELIDAVFSDPDALAPAPHPAAVRFEELRLVSLTCLRALALSASDLDDIEVFEYFLEGQPDCPEYAEALLGFALIEPQAARPYIQQCLGHVAEGEMGAIQAIFNLIDRQVATGELTKALIDLGEEKGYQPLIILHSFTEEHSAVTRQGGIIPGHDFPIEVKVQLPEDSHGILLRAKTVALFHDLVATCTCAWDSLPPATDI